MVQLNILLPPPTPFVSAAVVVSCYLDASAASSVTFLEPLPPFSPQPHPISPPFVARVFSSVALSLSL